MTGSADNNWLYIRKALRWMFNGGIAVSWYYLIKEEGYFEIKATDHREEEAAGSLLFYSACVFLHVISIGLSVDIQCGIKF